WGSGPRDSQLLVRSIQDVPGILIIGAQFDGLHQVRTRLLIILEKEIRAAPRKPRLGKAGIQADRFTAIVQTLLMPSELMIRATTGDPDLRHIRPHTHGR